MSACYDRAMLVRGLLFILGTTWALIACEQGLPDPVKSERVCTPPYSRTTPTAETVFCADPSAMQAAPVVRVVDGDTIRVTVEGVEEPVRFYGIDTPERGQRCFAEATDRTEELVETDVRLVSDARERDQNDRLLRYVYTPEGLSIDATLIGEGLAYAWTADGALRGPLVELEQRARRNEVGCLWSP